uniref:Putative secreted peptide n=1 Tax=Anopheles braziliensis TaxID=58242 RepID=A0A2M3ZPH6_9DIPT
MPFFSKYIVFVTFYSNVSVLFRFIVFFCLSSAVFPHFLAQPQPLFSVLWVFRFFLSNIIQPCNLSFSLSVPFPDENRDRSNLAVASAYY